LFGAGCATLLTAGFAAFLYAQNSTTAGAAAFEVASIKPNKTDAQVKEAMPPGRYIATNITLRFMIQTAYEKSPMNMGLALFEFEGGPDWIRSERFDVNAKASSNVPVQQIRLMLQNLLADRFHLRVHYETRQAPIYRLGLANRGGTLGKQLRRSDADCAHEIGDPYRGIVPGETYACGYFGPSATTSLQSGRADQAFRGMTMADLARRVQQFLGRPVIDGTGLTGYFDGTFEWTREIVMPPPPPGMPNPYTEQTLPSIFSVLPDQLGLKLESQRGPVQILVIDSADHPTPN
jgi:uncharacterized protein (TIGR03435 family)